MVETLLVGGIIFLPLIAVAGVLLVLRQQKQYMEQMRSQQQAWERALESRLRAWEQQQEKINAKLEQNMLLHIEQAKNTFAQQHTRTVTQLGIELELSKLPNIDESPIIVNQDGRSSGLPANWRPAALYRANLVRQDLSHRYLGRADLRGAQLIGANLYMADLSGACLAGANLAEADLSGTNLAHADLRNASLAGASLLVADLQGANLTGADLTNVRHLTAEQLRSIVYDEPPLPRPVPVVEDTQNTQLRMKAIRPAATTPSQTLSHSEKAAPAPFIRQTDVPNTEDIPAPLTFEEVEEEYMQPTAENIAVKANVTRPADAYEGPYEIIRSAEEGDPATANEEDISGIPGTADMLSEAPTAPMKETEAVDAMVAATPTGRPEGDSLLETQPPTIAPPVSSVAESSERDDEITDSRASDEGEPPDNEEGNSEATRPDELEQETTRGPLERPLMLSDLNMLPFVERLLNDLPSATHPSSDSLLDPKVTDLLLVRSPEGGS